MRNVFGVLSGICAIFFLFSFFAGAMKTSILLFIGGIVFFKIGNYKQQ